MKYTGTALCLGDHIDTDAIIPAKFLVTSDQAELGTHCMEGLDTDWIKKVTPGQSIMVAGRNFGCGASREHAPVAILGAGVSVVIAHSFARIFYRNAFNNGLLPLEINEAATEFAEGDEVEVDMQAWKITNKTTGKDYPIPPLPETMQGILQAGGLNEFVKKRLKLR